MWFPVPDFTVVYRGLLCEIRTRAHGEAIEALPSHHPREITFPSAAPAVGGSDISREWPSYPFPAKQAFKAFGLYRCLSPQRPPFFVTVTIIRNLHHFVTLGLKSASKGARVVDVGCEVRAHKATALEPEEG